MRISLLGILTLLACGALLSACNKQPARPVSEAEQHGVRAADAASPAAEAGSPDAGTAAAGPVMLADCPVPGLWLPEGSKIMGTDDQRPRGWAVSFDSPSGWQELVDQIEGQLKARGWTLDQSTPADGATLRYKSVDGIQSAVLINAFPELRGKARTNEEVQMLAQVEEARRVNPDFVFGIYQRVK